MTSTWGYLCGLSRTILGERTVDGSGIALADEVSFTAHRRDEALMPDYRPKTTRGTRTIRQCFPHTFTPHVPRGLRPFWYSPANTCSASGLLRLCASIPRGCRSRKPIALENEAADKLCRRILTLRWSRNQSYIGKTYRRLRGVHATYEAHEPGGQVDDSGGCAGR